MTSFTLASSNDTNMTSLRGYVKATYDQIVEKLGPPLDGPNNVDDKITCRWAIKFGNDVATIYDWKELATPMHGPHEWHIGGHSESIVEKVQTLIFGIQGA